MIRRATRIRLLTTACGITEAESHKRQDAERTLVRADVWYWLRNYAWFADPKTDDSGMRKIPLLMWDGQRKLVSFLDDGIRLGRKRVVNKARELGATWLACSLLYWHAAIANDREGFSVLAMSKSQDLVDEGVQARTSKSILGKVRFQHRMQPAFLRPEIAREAFLTLEFKDGGSFDGVSTNKHAGRSGRYAVVLSDEWAAVPANLQRPILLALTSVPRSWWRISTPEGKGNDFYQAVDSARKKSPEDLMELDWKVDPRRTQAWYESLLIENGGDLTWDERERTFNCSFAAVSGLRIFKAERDKITYTDADLARVHKQARKLWPIFLPMDFGSGPSWTVCLFVLVNWDIGHDGKPLKPLVSTDGVERNLPSLWVDREMVWQRENVADIGRAIMDGRKAYSDVAWHFGDPAGTAAESDQESWETNLQAAGVPIKCLPGMYNTEQVRDQSIIEVQLLLDLGRLKVHERCALLLESLESWEWDLPAGIPIAHVPREILKPRKDGWSHCFRGSQLVQTDHGLVTLRDLAGKEGLVPTPDGPRPFRDARMTRRDAALVRVAFADGSHIECTPDHRLAWLGGWVSAGDALGYDILGTWSPRSSLDTFRNSLASATTDTASGDTTLATIAASPRELSATYIGRSIWLRTVRSLRGSMFTMLTTTANTTARIISPPSRSPSTRDSIGVRIANASWRMLGAALSLRDLKPRSGMAVLPASAGTASTLAPWHLRSATSERARSASTAGMTSTPRDQASAPASVTSTARWPTTGSTGSRVVSVSPAGSDDVWCLTVPDTGCFYLASGHLVSNCGDSLRYCVGAALRTGRMAFSSVAKAAKNLPLSTGGELMRMFANVATTGRARPEMDSPEYDRTSQPYGVDDLDGMSPW